MSIQNKKDVNKELLNNLKSHLGVKSLSQSNLSNVLNTQISRLKKIENLEEEFTIKDLYIIQKEYKLDLDSIFGNVFSKKKEK